MLTIRIERTWQHGRDTRWIITAMEENHGRFILDSCAPSLRGAIIAFRLAMAQHPG